MRLGLRATTAVVALAVLGSCGGNDTDDGVRADEPAAARSAAGSTARVTIHTFEFQPDPITIDAGTTIVFTNDDKILHTVTSGTRAAPTADRFDGMLDGAGSHYEVTLDQPGTYPYFCSIHPGAGMTGEIIVR